MPLLPDLLGVFEALFPGVASPEISAAFTLD